MFFSISFFSLHNNHYQTLNLAKSNALTQASSLHFPANMRMALRIGLVAPLYESVPPRFYGGTERVVSYLAEGLKREGHSVTLYASGDSQTRAKLVECCPQALRLDANARDHLSPHLRQIETVVRDQKRFDLIHFHTDALFFAALPRLHVPSLITLHGRLDLAETQALMSEFPEANLVSISDAQREGLKGLNWKTTIHHGMPPDEIPFQEHPLQGKNAYLAFLGRISPEKRPDRAIEIAKKAGMKLKIAAKFDPNHPDYNERVIQLMKQPHVEFVGEIAGAEKAEFLRNATALLFPIDWPEPFGLVMMESLAAGTPVIAYPFGSVPEVIRNGENGRLVDNIHDAVIAVKHISEISRKQCRLDFERRFSLKAMAKNYVRIYDEILSESAALIRRFRSYAGDPLWMDRSL